MAFEFFLAKRFDWSGSSSSRGKTGEGPASERSLLGQVTSDIGFDLLSGSLHGEHNWLRGEGI